MRNMVNNEQIRGYMREVCQQIRAKEVHKEVKLELQSHIDEIVSEMMEQGVVEAEAVRKEIERMGDPAELGLKLHNTHKPRTDWSLLGLLVILIAVGLMAMYAVDLSGFRSGGQLFEKEGLYFGIGGVLLLILYFADYRKLQPYSWVLFWSALGLLVFVKLFGWNGYNLWSSNTVVRGSQSFSLYPYILLLGMAGMLQSKQWRDANIIRLWAVFIVVPCYLFALNNSLNSMALYLISAVILLCLESLRRLKWILSLSGVLIGTIIFIISINPQHQLVDRLISFLHPERDPNGSGYMATQSLIAIRSAGWQGHGFGAVLDQLPVIHSEMVFAYLIYSLGWLMGLGVAIVVGLFVLRMVWITKSIKDSYGKMLTVGMLSLFAIQFVWGMAMPFGLLPISSVAFPFLAFGRSQAVIQLMAVGLILGIYRRKDLLPALRSS